MNLEKFYKNLNKQTKAAMWFTICSFLQKGISFITVPIFTRLLTTEQYGVYTVYNSWLSILSIFTSLYIFNGVFDNLLSKYDDDRDRLTSSLVSLTFLIGTFCFIIYIILRDFLQPLFGLDNRLMIIMFVEMLFTPALHFWSERQRFEYQYKTLVSVTLARSFLNPALGLVLVLTMSDRAFARIISAVIVDIVFDGILLAVIIMRGKKLYIRNYWIYSLRLAFPLVPHYLSGMVLSHGDRVMIDRMIGKSEVALYGVAYNAGMMIQLFITAINSAVTPWTYKQMKERNIDNLHEKYKLLTLLVGILCLLFMVVSPEVVYIFGSEKYITAAPVIPPVVGSVFFIFMYSVLSFPQFYFEKTRFLMLSSIAAAILNIMLNCIFLRKIGYIAAGYTTMICYIVYSFGHYFVSKRILLSNDIKEDIISFPFLSIWTVIIVMICLISNFLFDFWYIRYLIVIFILVLAFFKRTFLLSLIKMMRETQ